MYHCVCVCVCMWLHACVRNFVTELHKIPWGRLIVPFDSEVNCVLNVCVSFDIGREE